MCVSVLHDVRNVAVVTVGSRVWVRVWVSVGGCTAQLGDSTEMVSVGTA